MTSGKQRLQPRKQPLQARAELTRQRILNAAAHVFAEHGYAAGTTNRIAEQARVSIGSLYQYYPNKDAILAELVTRHLDAGAAAMSRRRNGALPESLEAVIRLFVRASIENHLEDPHLLRVMMEQPPLSAALLERIARSQEADVEYVQELFERHPEVRVADTAMAARVAVSAIEFIVHPLVAEPGPVDPTRLENELVAMLTRYLRG